MQASSTSDDRLPNDQQRPMPEPGEMLAWFVLAVAFFGLNWASFAKLGHVWWNNEDYQYGPFVPMFSIFLLWYRREMIVPFLGRGSLWGLVFFAIWALMRWTANFFNYESLPEMSIIPFLAGLAIFVGGWQGIRWSWPAIVFLAFMIPLPGYIQGIARLKMQLLATHLSVFVIQTLGIPAVPEGVVINLTDKPLRVAEACSGLRMLSLFIAGCVGAAFVLKKPLWERLLLVASAVPIAIASNVVRIVMTALFCEFGRRWPTVVSPEKLEHWGHDISGYAMPIVGLLLLLIEVKLLSKLLIEPLPERPLMLGNLAGEGTAVGGNRTMQKKV